MASINNFTASPKVIALGIDDQSIRPAVPTADQFPTHLPKTMGFAAWGPTTPQLVTGDALTYLYGARSFDLTGPYATAATTFVNMFARNANAQIFQRLRPDDAGDNATLRIYIDLLPAKVDEYERSFDGRFKLDEFGQKIKTGQKVDGYKVKFIRKEVALDAQGESTFGQGSIANGTMTDADSGVQSEMYPFLDLRASHFGAQGRNFGIRLSAPTMALDLPPNPRIPVENKAFVYRLSVVQRADEMSLPTYMNTNAAEKFRDVVFKKEQLDKSTRTQISFEDNFPSAWQDTERVGYAPNYGAFNDTHLYSENLEHILALLYAAEQPFFDGSGDFQGTGADEHHLYNFVSGTSSFGVPYHSFELVRNGADAMVFTENSTAFAFGGSDGTMTPEVEGELVRRIMDQYADPDSNVLDDARNPESYFWDPGYDLATKYSMLQALALRKDIGVAISVFDVNGRQLSASEESSLAESIYGRGSMYPESTYYGTKVARLTIIGRNGILHNSEWKKRLPLTYEIASNISEYMGSSQRRWRREKRFDAAPGSVVKLFRDINETYTPESVRNRDWANGMIWAQSFGYRSDYFPALQTAYPEDSSILNNVFAQMACIDLQKVGHRSHRQFSGSILPAQTFVEEVKKWIENEISEVYDERFDIRVDVYIDSFDEQRGYSWHTKIKIGGGTMRTVNILTLEARRLDDMDD